MSAAWELLSTRTGGSVTSLVATPTTVFAATPAGLRCSPDSGRSWMAFGGVFVPPMELAVPSRTFASTGIVLAGTADGLHASADGGQTWRAVLAGSRVLAIAFINDQLLLVGSEQDGILRSEDGGRSWASANPGLLDLTVLALACSPEVDTDETLFAATASGLFWSRNTGRTWRAIDTLPGEPAVQCLALSPSFAQDLVVLAGTEADGLFRSTDAGITWQAADTLLRRSVTALAWSQGGNAAAATDTGVAVSNDAGASWKWIGRQLGPVLSLTFTGDGGLLAGLPHLGLVRSSDLAIWHAANDGLLANLVIALAITADHAMYIAGLEDGVSVSRDAGVSWVPANEGLEAELAVFGLAAQSEHVYTATSNGLFKRVASGWQQVHPSAARAICADERRIVAAGLAPELLISEDAGATWLSLAVPADIGQPNSIAVAGPSTLIIGSSSGVWHSSDGRTWQPLRVGVSPSVVVLSPTYQQDRTLLAGTSAGIYVSRDAGGAFESWSEGMGDAPIVAMAFSPTYATDREVYAIELGGRIWRRRDQAYLGLFSGLL